MAILARFNFSNTTTAVGDFTSAPSHDVLGTQFISGPITGEITQPFFSRVFNGTPEASAVYDDYPRATIQRGWTSQGLSSTNGQIKYSGFSPNTEYEFLYVGHDGSAGKVLSITDGAQTVTYTTSSDPSVTVNAPTSLITQSDANGEITHTYYNDDFSTATLSAVIIQEVGPSLTITDPIIPGATIAFTASGFSGAINSAVFGDGTSTLALTNITNVTGDDWTADVPADIDAAGTDLAYGSVTLTVGDGTDTADTSVDLQTVAANDYIDVVSPSTAEGGIFFDYSGTAPATGDQIEWTNASVVTVNADGTWSATTSDASFDARSWSAADTEWSDWSTFELAEATIVSGVRATSAVGSATAVGASQTTATGVEATTSTGTLSGAGAASTTLVGVKATSAVGNVTLPGQQPIATPTGVQAITNTGTAVASGSAETQATGVAATTAVGAAAANGETTSAVTGVQVAVSVGSVDASVSATAAVTGVEAQTAVGSVDVEGLINVILTGVSVVVRLGRVEEYQGRKGAGGTLVRPYALTSDYPVVNSPVVR